MSDMSPEVARYIVFAVSFSCVVLLILRYVLRHWDEQRRDRIQKTKKLQEPISIKSPLRFLFKQSQERAVRSVEHRFSIIRRLFTLLLLIVGILVVIFPFLGTLPTTLLSVLAAATSIIIGIAAKPFLENFIAGIVLTFSQPFRTGDTILIDGEFYGTVEDLTMNYTILKTWDWQRYVIPNSVMMTKHFVNYTLKDSYLWAYVEFWVEPGADLEKVEACAIKAAENSALFMNYEPPNFWVMETGEKGVRCWVATWAASPNDAWYIKSDIRIALLKELTALGISPHRFSLNVNNAADVIVDR